MFDVRNTNTESYSQMYHQVFGIPSNPFSKHTSFYKFAREYVQVRQRKINSNYVNDYSRGMKKILDEMKPYTISFTQKEAGFVNEINEEIMWVEMNNTTYVLAERLKKDRVVEGNDNTILGDTPAKLMQKLHQLYSGTVKFESGDSITIDRTKQSSLKITLETKR